jgi:VIT1/CCC1 family predicted Fe2+/Mn2+ transporter
MAKTHKHRKNTMNRINKFATKVIPAVGDGLNTVGKTAKGVAKKSLPVIEKGVSAVYGTMVSGLDLGIKGARSVSKKISTMGKTSRRKKRSNKSRSHK